MGKYIESGIYTKYNGQPAIYIGKYETRDGELRHSFCDIPINVKETITRDIIIKILRENGTEIIKYITLTPNILDMIMDILENFHKIYMNQ